MHHNKKQWLFIFIMMLLLAFTTQEYTSMKKFKLAIHSEVLSHINESGKRHILEKEVNYTIKYVEDGVEKFYIGVIPMGYPWSASIPSALQWAVGRPLDEKFKNGSLIHDILCDINFDGKVRDLVFRSLLKRDGVGYVRRNIMYWAVVKYRKAKTWLYKKIGKKQPEFI